MYIAILLLFTINFIYLKIIDNIKNIPTDTQLAVSLKCIGNLIRYINLLLTV